MKSEREKKLRIGTNRNKIAFISSEGVWRIDNGSCHLVIEGMGVTSGFLMAWHCIPLNGDGI